MRIPGTNVLPWWAQLSLAALSIIGSVAIAYIESEGRFIDAQSSEADEDED